MQILFKKIPQSPFLRSFTRSTTKAQIFFSRNENILIHANERNTNTLDTMKERERLEVTTIPRSLDLLRKVKM